MMTATHMPPTCRGHGVVGYVATPGNRGVWMLRRDLEDVTEFVMFTLWDSMEAVRGFAGDDPETAVFYPEDDRFLVERDLRSHNFEVVTHAPGVGAPGGEPESDLRPSSGSRRRIS